VGAAAFADAKVGVAAAATAISGLAVEIEDSVTA